MAQAKFEQIKQFLLSKIESGEWPENTKVPSENKLATDFSVSRMTARRALQDLREQGVLSREQGSGSYVSSFKTQSSMLEVNDIAQEIRSRNRNYTAVVHEAAEVKAIAPIAIALGVEIDSLVYHTVISHCQDGVPIQVEDRYINPALIPHYLEQDFTQITPHEYLCEVAPLTEAKVVIEAVMPSEQMKQWLEIFNDEPCLQVQRRTWSSKGVVNFATLVHPGSKYRLGSHLTMKKK